MLVASMAVGARAQQTSRTYRVGAIFGGGPAAMTRYRAALVDQLAKYGFSEGRNLVIVARAGSEIFDLDRNVVREILAAKVDALFTCLTRITQAAHAEARSLPIVFTWVSDPIEAGLIKSYAHPGGNVTGVTNRFGELLLKRLELASFAAAGELVTGERVLHYLNTQRIPAVFADGEMVEQGGLMSYGTNLVDDIKRGADLLAKVLKGSRPADLPVDQAARFELAVNMSAQIGV